MFRGRKEEVAAELQRVGGRNTALLEVQLLTSLFGSLLSSVVVVVVVVEAARPEPRRSMSPPGPLLASLPLRPSSHPSSHSPSWVLLRFPERPSAPQPHTGKWREIPESGFVLLEPRWPAVLSALLCRTFWIHLADGFVSHSATCPSPCLSHRLCIPIRPVEPHFTCVADLCLVQRGGLSLGGALSPGQDR